MMMAARGIGLRLEADRVLQYMLWLGRIMPLQKLPWKQINGCVVDDLRNAGLIEQILNNPRLPKLRRQRSPLDRARAAPSRMFR
jgi:hypothetical protein